MNKKLKFISAFLAISLLITPISGLINNYDNVANANNYSNIKKGLYIDGKWYNFDNNGYWI